jgi:glycosyltransferase involved in cell wall biosynthesis
MISVVIPTGDKAKVPSTTLDAIEAQSYKNNELIFVEGPKVCVNRNAGAKQAKGDFLFFCDEDVTLEPDCLFAMREALRKNPGASYAYCDYARTGTFDGVLQARHFNAAELKMGNYVSTMSLIRKVDFPGFALDVERLQDWDLWLTMLEQGKTGVYVPMVGFTAHFSESGISSRGMDDYWQAVQKVKNRHPLFFPVVKLNV